MKRRALIFALGIVVIPAASPALAQKPQFEVASIKSNTSGDGRVSLDISKGRFKATNVSVRILLRYAFDPGLPKEEMDRGRVLFSNASAMQIADGPGWIANDHFDVEAKPAVGHTVSQDELQLMMQSLLEDRFQLKLHREMRDMPTYDLVVVRGPTAVAARQA